ncbi:hypothetical protein A8A01_01110 [Ewingella americana]|nr:hypothetical protein A8A01_01110 [Ewingella americana]
MHQEDKIAALRWQIATFVARVGRIPLLLSCLPCGLLAFWLTVMVPQTSFQRENLEQLQAQLRMPLPLDSRQPELQNRVSQSEYQQVGLVFDKLIESGLKVEASRYQLEKAGEKSALQLDIPLQGEYLPLVEALETLSRTMPLSIEQITLRRLASTQSQLNVTLQLRLLKETP